MFEDDFNRFWILFEHLLEKRHYLAAVRSFEVAEYSDGDGCIGLAFEW